MLRWACGRPRRVVETGCGAALTSVYVAVQAATRAIAAAQAGQAESGAELERFKERSDAIQRRVAATGSVLQQVCRRISASTDAAQTQHLHENGRSDQALSTARPWQPSPSVASDVHSHMMIRLPMSSACRRIVCMAATAAPCVLGNCSRSMLCLLTGGSPMP